MNLKAYIATWNSAARVAFTATAAALVLTLVVMMLTWELVTRKERVVLIPPYLDERVEVAWKEASAPYLRSFGLYVATLIGNVTPKNIAFVRDHLSVFMSPKSYGSVRAALTSLAQDRLFQEGANIRYFSPYDVIWEKETNRVFVVGRETVANPNNSQPTIVSRVYEMQIVINNGQPVILGLTNYSGQQPRTQKWLQNNSDFVRENPSIGQPPPPLKESDLPQPTPAGRAGVAESGTSTPAPSADASTPVIHPAPAPTKP